MTYADLEIPDHIRTEVQRLIDHAAGAHGGPVYIINVEDDGEHRIPVANFRNRSMKLFVPEGNYSADELRHLAETGTDFRIVMEDEEGDEVGFTERQLRRAGLRIPNGTKITLRAEGYNVEAEGEWLTIGCQRHKLDAWLTDSVADRVIGSFGHSARRQRQMLAVAVPILKERLRHTEPVDVTALRKEYRDVYPSRNQNSKPKRKKASAETPTE